MANAIQIRFSFMLKGNHRRRNRIMIIARVVIYLSCFVVMFCFDKRKDIVGDIALGLLLIAIAYALTSE